MTQVWSLTTINVEAQCYTASDLGPAEAQHGKRSIGQTAMFSAGLREALEANGQIGKHAQSWATPDWPNTSRWATLLRCLRPDRRYHGTMQKHIAHRPSWSGQKHNLEGDGPTPFG